MKEEIQRKKKSEDFFTEGRSKYNERKRVKDDWVKEERQLKKIFKKWTWQIWKNENLYPWRMFVKFNWQKGSNRKLEIREKLDNNE